MPKSKEALPVFLFHQGTNYKTYEYMGAHCVNGEYVFRTWAPHAYEVFVVGDFNSWSESFPMTRISDGGIWEAKISVSLFSDSKIYKFKLKTPNGELYKADPYGYKMQKPPETASEIFDISGYKWKDSGWLEHRRATMSEKANEQPINIYEVHLGSWKKHDDGSFLTYGELANELAPYIKQMGYTHVELMPVMEHPFDGSWGYQVCGYYAPSSRYGTPQDFMEFIDIMHEAGIGVILDWVPAHFPKDAHGLYEFDGEPLYEYQGADRMEHKGWGTRCFDVGRNEVECFLVSNAMYWADVYHADGLRVDAVASMLYLDYDRRPGEWTPNIYGENKSLEAIAFFKKLNSAMKEFHPDVLVIAEESTAWSNITGFNNEGLGFSFKWNMGWMNDILSYEEMDPIYRKYHHNKTTFSLTYCFSEKYILPISHDEVVHGKRSLLDKMPGEYSQKFANTRSFVAYMMTHPGKKLMFMGCEIGQFKEWSYEGQIEWFLLDYDMHSKLQLYFADINHLYLETPALYEQDDSWDGFEWIDPDNNEKGILSYRRKDREGNEIIVVINSTPVVYHDFKVRVPVSGVYEEIFNSDNEKYGGYGVLNDKDIVSTELCGEENIEITVPSMGAMFFRLKK